MPHRETTKPFIFFFLVLLSAIGRGAASTKYAALSSLGNVPVVYMTGVDGWAHDRFGTG